MLVNFFTGCAVFSGRVHVLTDNTYDEHMAVVIATRDFCSGTHPSGFASSHPTAPQRGCRRFVVQRYNCCFSLSPLSNLIATASTLLAMASNLIAMASSQIFRAHELTINATQDEYCQPNEHDELPISTGRGPLRVAAALGGAASPKIRFFVLPFSVLNVI